MRTHTIVPWAAVAVLALGLLGCDRDPAPAAPDAAPIDAGTDGSIDGPTDTAPDAPSGSCESQLIGPEGGTITHSFGAKLIVPVGAVADATEFSLCPTTTPLVVGATAVGHAFEARPTGQTFLRPIEVVIPFDPTLVASNIDLDTIQMQMTQVGLPGQTGTRALSSQVDLATGLVVAGTTLFTEFVPMQAPAPLFITTSPTLPTGTVGVPYSRQFAATGGTPPYTWSLAIAGSLPPGLTLTSSGFLGGTPTTPSNFTFFIAVSDSANHSVAVAATLTVISPTNPVPMLSNITPSSIPQGSATTVLTLSGAGFMPTAQVLLDGQPIPTTFVSASQLRASLVASVLVTAGSHQVAVANPPPGGGTSASRTITVVATPLNPVPSLATVSPTLVPVAPIDIQITVTGSSFIAQSVVMIGSQALDTNFVSTTQLAAKIPASYLTAPGSLSIRVFNPAPGGGLSSAVTILIGTLNPFPMITLLSPDSVAVGAATFTLTVSGTDFVQGAKVFFGSTALATTFVSSGQVTATVPAALVAIPAPVDVVVVNPTPGGGASNRLTFDVVGQCTLGSAQATVGSAPRDVAVGDFDEDGFEDLVATAQNSNAVTVLRGTGTGSFGAGVNYPSGNAPLSVAVADFNGDNHLDLAVGNYCNLTPPCTVNVLLGNGLGAFGAAVPFTVGSGVNGAQGVVTADFDGDGHVDLAVANRWTASVIRGAGTGSFGPPTTLSIRTGNYVVRTLAVADFNGDGRSDLVATDQGCMGCVPSASGVIGVFLSTGASGFAAPVVTPAGNGTYGVAAGDFNGDAHVDLVVASSQDIALGVLLGTGSGTFATMVPYTMAVVPNSLDHVQVADFDRDGHLDLIALINRGNGPDGLLSVLVGTGTGDFQVPTMFSPTFPVGTSVEDFAVGNFNGDTIPDYAVTNQVQNTINVRLGVCQ